MKFKVSISGWKDNEQQSRARALLLLTDEQMGTKLQVERNGFLIPRDFSPETVITLEPEELGWCYTVSDSIRFRE